MRSFVNYTSTYTSIIRVIRSWRIRRDGYIVRKGRREMHRIFWLGHLKGREYLEDLGVDEKIILDWVLGK
jgi:hypothetical protein